MTLSSMYQQPQNLGIGKAFRGLPLSIREETNSSTYGTIQEAEKKPIYVLGGYQYKV